MNRYNKNQQINNMKIFINFNKYKLIIKKKKQKIKNN